MTERNSAPSTRPASRLARAARLLTPPQFEDDEDKTRIAGLLNTISLAFLAITVLGGVATVAQSPTAMNAAIVATTLGLVIVVQVLMRRGAVKTASLVMSGGLWLVVTYISATGGGVMAVSLSSYILVILMVGLLAGGLWVFVATGVSIAASVVLYLVEVAGLLVTVQEPNPEFALVVQTAYFVMAAVLIFLPVRGLQQALARARRTNVDLQATQAALSEQVAREQAQRQELQRLMEAEQEQRENLQRILARVHDAATNLGSAAAEILAATTQQVTGAHAQSTALSQTTTTVDEVRVITDQSVDRAQELADTARHTVEVSRAGQASVEETVSGMSRIKEQVEGIAHNILALSAQTQQIGEIITTVSDLASQSNMLALNAAVEAARAGDQGKGFAVVAQEVRSLAEQSKRATAQVRGLLEEIQARTNATVMATEEGTKRVDEGVQLVAQTGQVIMRLAEVIDESAQAAMQMVAGGRQQATGVEQIGLAMGTIHQATDQSLASTRQAERAAQDLNDLARQLMETVQEFSA
ncbi:MAG: methyl-accepting chemotaxis protein [Anaerolineae bacterium]